MKRGMEIMAEYIERSQAIKELTNAYEYEYPTASGAFDEFATTIMPNVLKNIPSADVVEVVHGEWKDDKFINGRFPSVRCSECNIRFCDIISNHRCMWNFCPSCGAKMRGGKNG